MECDLEIEQPVKLGVLRAINFDILSALDASIPGFCYTSDSSCQDVVGGHPVGSLAACPLSEAAYSALDQPVSILEPSPLMNLKKLLESGSRRTGGGKRHPYTCPRNLASMPMDMNMGRWKLKGIWKVCCFQTCLRICRRI